jgi:hypothetical protein
MPNKTIEDIMETSQSAVVMLYGKQRFKLGNVLGHGSNIKVKVSGKFENLRF